MNKSIVIASIAASSLLIGPSPSFSAPYEAGGGTASGADSVAIGNAANANGGRSLAIGRNTEANDLRSLAIGSGVETNGERAIGLGSAVTTNGDSAIAIGDEVEADEVGVAIGAGSNADYAAIAIGEDAEAGEAAIAIGEDAEANEVGVAIGEDTDAEEAAVAIGIDAEADEVGVAIGAGSDAEEAAVAIGVDAEADSEAAVAIGPGAFAGYEASTAIGANSATTRSNQIVLGSNNTELTVPNLEGTDTGVTYVETDGTLRRSSVTANMLEGFDGRINKLGDGVAASTALTSAMGALPTVSPDSKLTCGVGTGAYSGATAVALGCATRINDRFSMNIGGSKVLQGSSSYDYGSGSLDSFAARAGLVMRLGKIHKPNATGQELQARLRTVEAENQELNEKNAELIAKYSSMERQNKQFMARLERLEAIALGTQPKTDELAVVPATSAK